MYVTRNKKSFSANISLNGISSGEGEHEASY